MPTGGSGWRNFEDFKQRVIDRSKTRVLAFLNIVGNGMRGARYENDVTDMQPDPTAEMVKRYTAEIKDRKVDEIPPHVSMGFNQPWILFTNYQRYLDQFLAWAVEQLVRPDGVYTGLALPGGAVLERLGAFFSGDVATSIKTIITIPRSSSGFSIIWMVISTVCVPPLVTTVMVPE